MTVASGEGLQQLIDAAMEGVDTIDVNEAMQLHGQDGVIFVDVRDVRELARDGRIPGAFHMPRGMTEFWVAPESPYHKEVFDQDARFVFYCAAQWRSALSVQAAMRVGLQRVCHFEGGLGAWREAGGAIEKSAR